MTEQKFEELENRAAQAPAMLDEIRKLEARARVHHEIEAMKAEGKALELSEEERQMAPFVPPLQAEDAQAR